MVILNLQPDRDQSQVRRLWLVSFSKTRFKTGLQVTRQSVHFLPQDINTLLRMASVRRLALETQGRSYCTMPPATLGNFGSLKPSWTPEYRETKRGLWWCVYLGCQSFYRSSRLGLYVNATVMSALQPTGSRSAHVFTRLFPLTPVV